MSAGTRVDCHDDLDILIYQEEGLIRESFPPFWGGRVQLSIEQMTLNIELQIAT